MSKPMALAAFAAKQQRIEPLEGLSKTEVRCPGRTLSNLKARVLGGGVGGNVKPLTQSSVRGGGDILASPTTPLEVLAAIGVGQKLVTSPRKSTDNDQVVSGLETKATARTAQTQRSSSLKLLAPVDNENQGKTDEADRSSTPDETSQAEQEEKSSKSTVDSSTEISVNDTLGQDEKRGTPVTDSKPPKEDQSDDDDFNFADADADEKEDVESLAPQVEPLETKAGMVDVEGLYDCPPDNSEDARSQEKSVVQVQPKMFLPRASDIELFHVVLTDDTSQLKLLLEEISPQEMLEIVDTTGRTLYHYAALSKNKVMQNMVFQHVSTYRDNECDLEVEALMRKKQHLNGWMHESQAKRGGWMPPRLKELQRERIKQKCADWARICSSVDENGRSLFHYLASTTGTIPVEDDYEFCSVLRSRDAILSTRDHFKKLALHYAVEIGNIKQVKWNFHMGVNLNQADVDLLLSFSVSRVMENVILRQLEAIDMKNYYLPTCIDAATDPGVSTFALAKLQRITDDSAGRLHQFPLHRAAMFGNIRAVDLLLEEGADPNARDANLWTALHYCADEATPSHLAIAQLLMEKSTSVDINAQSLKGRSALHIAARARQRNLLHEEDNPRSTTESSESESRVSFVVYLHDAKADLDLKDAKGATPLLLACQGGHVGVVRFLLSAGCDPTATGENKWNALHFAASRGDATMVSLLQSWDADSRLWMNSQDKQGRKPIDVANDSIRRILVNLWTECYSGNVNQVRCLLQTHNSQAIRPTGSLSVKAKTVQTERTPLHLAVLGYADALQMLETSNTRTPSREEHLKNTKASELNRTAPSRYLQMVVLLLQAGADLGAGDKWGITPLMLAARLKDSIFMDTLLDRTATESDLLAADVDGNTALHYSYAFCQAQVSTLLEDQMDDSDVETKQGKSPFEMTGYGDKIYPKEYREFLKRQQALRRRQIGK